VITSTGAGQLFTPETARLVLQRRRNKPVFFIDIAVPRDVDPAVNDLEGCFVYDVDDLQQVAMQNKAVRNHEAEAAETIVSSEVARYSEQISRAPSREAIKQLMLDAEALRMQEIARTVQQLSSVPLSEEQMAAVDRLTKSLIGKLLHPQIAALREESD
jgi:glutamyl-tRNA reductase